jgi:hypothetical protein
MAFVFPEQAPHRSSVLADHIELRLNPVEKGIYVFVRTLAQEAVIEFLKGFAVPGRSAHIGENYCDAEFVEIVIVDPQEIRPNLPLRTSVNVVSVNLTCGEFLKKRKRAGLWGHAHEKTPET